MATYTITVDERTREGKSLVRYLRDLGVIVEPNDATLAAVKEIQKVIHIERPSGRFFRVFSLQENHRRHPDGGGCVNGTNRGLGTGPRASVRHGRLRPAISIKDSPGPAQR